MSKVVDVEIVHNQAGDYSLCISDKNSGFRVSGAKVGGCETLKTFTVDVSELIKVIKEHAYVDNQE